MPEETPEERQLRLAQQLMDVVRNSPILDQAEVERIMVDELRAMGYTVEKRFPGDPGYTAYPEHHHGPGCGHPEGSVKTVYDPEDLAEEELAEEEYGR